MEEAKAAQEAKAAMKLLLDALKVVREWSARRGIPWFTIVVPPHLSAFAGIFYDPDLWDRLIGMQHDEKDIYRQVGVKGLLDWGDGEAKSKIDELEAANSSVTQAVGNLRKLAPLAAADQSHYQAVIDELRDRLAQLRRYGAEAAERGKRLAAKATQARAKFNKLVAGETTKMTSLRNQIELCEGLVKAISSNKDSIDQLAADVTSASSSTRTTRHTASALIELLERAQKLLGAAFDLANSPASKVLAMVSCSLFNCDAWTVAATYIFPDRDFS